MTESDGTNSPHDDTPNRMLHRATGDRLTIREDVEGDEDTFEIRMPIASSGEVRNQGDDPLTREELDGMARQLDERQIGVFPAHGSGNMIAAGRYSPFERLGNWQGGDVETREESDDDLLMATARMPDPETLPAATGAYREALAILKEQAKRGVGQDASIGWRDDESFPGGVDLMEASIVGIGADWRTNTGDEEAEVVARAAVEAGADPDDLVSQVRDAVRSPSLGHTYGPMQPELSHEGVSLGEGELYCHDTDEVNDVGGPRSEIECPACGEVLDGTELMADLNTDSDAQDHDMTDDDTDTPADDAGEQSDEPDESRQPPEWADRMLELLEDTNDTLQSVADAVREDDMDDDEDEGDDPDEENEGDGEDDEDEDEEQSADTDADDDARDLRGEVETLREELSAIRDGGLTSEDVDTPAADTDDEQDADADDESGDGDTDATRQHWREELPQ